MTDVTTRGEDSAARNGTVPSPRQDRQTVNSQATPSSSGNRAETRRRSRRKKRSTGKIAAITTSALVLTGAGVGVALYERLNGNIRSVAISGGGSEKPDAFGRTPINVLALGSDGRNNAADCKVGGDCGPGENADVEMIMHISADRSNATVMSIPRDTVTQIPPCNDSGNHISETGYVGTINSALQYGPECQVAAVHQLTGIPIDHFIKIDFSGVVNMSDAIGGVQVCVNNNVYDTDSHLKLSKGTHTLRGLSALEWLRSRHAFGDGSDLGRTYTQHMFLSALIRKLKSAGTLTNPTDLYPLADAATKALTVDTGLGSIDELIGLANDINKVPANRITFTTMQTNPDPHDDARVIIDPAAHSLFSAIINDQSLTTASGGKSAAASATSKATAKPSPTPPAVSDSQIAIRVENGGGVTGRAADIAQDLISLGFSPDTGSANAPAPASSTSIHYAPGQQAEAQAVATALEIPNSRLHQASSVSNVTLIIGSDWSSGSTFPLGSGGSSKPAPADTHRALSNAHAETADQAGTCAQVSTYPTLKFHGVWMSPIEAYAIAPNVPNSAP